MRIETVSPLFIDQVWHNVQPYIQKAIDRNGGRFFADQLKEECRTGRSTLLFFMDGEIPAFSAIVTFETWHRGRVANVNLVCGASLGVWQAELSNLKKWCADAGAKSLVLAGGDAYQRVFPEVKKEITVYSMEIG